jgi:hypothetical protein
MAIRFRRRIKVVPGLSVNVSKTGASVSVRRLSLIQLQELYALVTKQGLDPSTFDVNVLKGESGYTVTELPSFSNFTYTRFSGSNFDDAG